MTEEHLEYYIDILKNKNKTLEERRCYVALCYELIRRWDEVEGPRPDLVGKLVYKEFPVGLETKWFCGKVTKWDAPYFKVHYPSDGQTEDMTVDEVESQLLKLSDCFDWIEVSGGRHMTFASILKLFNVVNIHRVYRSVGLGNLPRHMKISPSLWPCLGSHEFEKVENAKKIIEYVFCN